jgi:hypothetical protein
MHHCIHPNILHLIRCCFLGFSISHKLVFFLPQLLSALM